jgi:hypothetical protein
LGWELTSHAKMVEAGYLFVREVVCRRCGRAILLYRKVGARTTAVEKRGFRHHRELCRPPAPAAAESVTQGELF